MGTVGSHDRSTNELVTAVGSFDSALEALDRQSIDWQSILENLNYNLDSDVQSSLRVEITNLVKSGILASSAEFRCNVEFLRIRIEQQLRRIRNSIAQEINNIGLFAPIPLLQEIPLEPYISNAIPSSIDMSLDPDRRSCIDIYGFDFRSVPITVEVVDIDARRNVNHALGIIGDLHMVLDVTSNGAALNETSRQIVFSWNERAQSVIPILSTDLASSCTTFIYTVHPDTITFTPPHMQGDSDFAGHGPWVRFTLDVSIDAECRNLYADYTFEAFESRDHPSLCPVGDKTAAWGSGSILLHTTTQSPIEYIVSIDTSNHFEFTYIDDDHQVDNFQFSHPSPIEELLIVGDIKGEDAGLETSVTVIMREITIQVKQFRY